MPKVVAGKNSAAADNQLTNLTLDDARELLALTDRIVTNLQVISAAIDGEDGFDLEEMARQTDGIAVGLRAVSEMDVPDDLEEMERKIGSIVSGLRTIDEDKNNLDDLENQVDSIVEGLNAITAAEVRA
jgi:hypothetical protein